MTQACLIDLTDTIWRSATMEDRREALIGFNGVNGQSALSAAATAATSGAPAGGDVGQD